MRYQWISRVLGNDLIDVGAVMAPFAREVLTRSAEGGRTIVAMIDQSKVNDAHQMLMSERLSLTINVRSRVVACRRTCVAAGVAHEENPRRHRLFRAEGGTGGRRGTAAFGRARGADGRPLLWFTGLDRVVPRAWLGLAFALAKQDLLVFDENGGETVKMLA